MLNMIMPASKENPTPQAFGTVAEMLLATNGDLSGLRTNTTLRQDEWKMMDEAILRENRRRLIGVADLKSRGLTMDLGNGLATMIFEYERVGSLGRAQMTMDGETQGARDRLTFDVGYLPIPIIFQDYSINARVLAASRLRGSSIDTTTGEEAGKSVAEELEILLFQGASSFTYGSGVLYGYTDAPNRMTGTGTIWGNSGSDPVTNVRAMKQQMINARFYGPYVVYIPTAYETVLDDDYVAGYPKTVRARLLEIGNIEDVKVADFCPANTLIMVNMNSSTVRMVSGMGVTNLQWTQGAGMRTYFKVMTIDVPQIRYDKSLRCGIVHWTMS